jgi:hypothetical protein
MVVISVCDTSILVSQTGHPGGVAAVPDLRNGEGKKSPLSRLPADNTESATQSDLIRLILVLSPSRRLLVARPAGVLVAAELLNLVPVQL